MWFRNIIFIFAHNLKHMAFEKKKKERGKERKKKLTNFKRLIKVILLTESFKGNSFL